MARRFAPADIRADLTALPENERRALAKLVDAARLMDSFFLRQVWAGNDAMLQELAHDAIGRSRPSGTPRRNRAGSPALLPHQQRALVATRSQSRLRPGRPGQARRGQLLSGGSHEGRSAEVARFADRRREGARDWVLHDDPAQHHPAGSPPFRTASNTRESWHARHRCCARPRT